MGARRAATASASATQRQEGRPDGGGSRRRRALLRPRRGRPRRVRRREPRRPRPPSRPRPLELRTAPPVSAAAALFLTARTPVLRPPPRCFPDWTSCGSSSARWARTEAKRQSDEHRREADVLFAARARFARSWRRGARARGDGRAAKDFFARAEASAAQAYGPQSQGTATGARALQRRRTRGGMEETDLHGAEVGVATDKVTRVLSAVSELEMSALKVIYGQGKNSEMGAREGGAGRARVPRGTTHRVHRGARTGVAHRAALVKRRARRARARASFSRNTVRHLVSKSRSLMSTTFSDDR